VVIKIRAPSGTAFNNFRALPTDSFHTSSITTNTPSPHSPTAAVSAFFVSMMILSSGQFVRHLLRQRRFANPTDAAYRRDRDSLIAFERFFQFGQFVNTACK
jgi:hypothetical protein